MRKAICIISNIFLSYFYISTSWMISAAALFYLMVLGWRLGNATFILWFAATALIFLTPVFCVLGIILSILRWRKERYLGAFVIQFLPFGIYGLSCLLFLLPMWLQL